MACEFEVDKSGSISNPRISSALNKRVIAPPRIAPTASWKILKGY